MGDDEREYERTRYDGAVLPHDLEVLGEVKERAEENHAARFCEREFVTVHRSHLISELRYPAATVRFLKRCTCELLERHNILVAHTHSV